MLPQNSRFVNRFLKSFCNIFSIFENFDMNVKNILPHGAEQTVVSVSVTTDLAAIFNYAVGGVTAGPSAI